MWAGVPGGSGDHLRDIWERVPAPGWGGGVLGTGHSLKGTIPMTSLYPEQGL